jgi:hypothetical protein
MDLGTDPFLRSGEEPVVPERRDGYVRSSSQPSFAIGRQLDDRAPQDDLMLRDKAELAATISAENGKSLADATAEVVYAAEFFRWFSEEAVRAEGQFGEAPAGGVRAIVHHRPVWVAALSRQSPPGPLAEALPWA